MAIKESALLFSARNRGSSIAGDGINFSFDIITNESHSWNLKVATHPVQDNSPFSDHIQKEIRKGSLVGLISNFGLKRDLLESNYAQDIFDLFEYYRDNAVPVTIATALKIYENYIITNVSSNRSGSSGEAQSFSVSFQEFRIVKLKYTEGISAINIIASDIGGDDTDATQASPNADVGEQTAEVPTGTGKLERFFNFTDFASGAYK